MLMRLASISFSLHLLKLFGFMLPLVCVFAFPIAGALAVGITVGHLFAQGESVLLHFFPHAGRSCKRAVVFFSLCLAIVYAPLIFVWSPGGYWAGKRFLIQAAQQQIENLPSQKFHQIASKCTIYFKGKEKTGEGYARFNGILLRATEKGTGHSEMKKYLVTAHHAILQKGVMTFFDGTLYNNSIRNHCIATFKEMVVEFEKIFFHEIEGRHQKPTKFMLFGELVEAYKKDGGAFKEMHKRIAQLLWILLIPLIMFWGMMILAKEKSNLLLGVILGGSLFLFSYISLNMAYIFKGDGLLPIAVLYGIPVAVGLIFYSRYKKRWG